MHKSNKQLTFATMIVVLSLIATSVTVLARPSAANLFAVSPTLDVLLEFSVLGGAAVTNTDTYTILTGAVGVSPGTSITNFPPGTASDIYISGIDAIADLAQAEALQVFGELDQPGCDVDWRGTGQKQLGGLSLAPGVYCADSFLLSGEPLTLTGGAEEVYIFRSTFTLITESGSSVIGGDPCNVWWRVGSSATLGTNSNFIGNVFSQTGVSAMTTGADLAGRFIGLTPVTITLDDNTITAPVCLVAPAPPPEAESPEAEEASAPTPVPGALPDTGGDLDGVPGSQIIQISLGALGLSLVLFGFMVSRRTQKTEG